MVTVDLSNHWRYITGRETVQYFSKAGERIPPTPTATVPNAKREELEREWIVADAQFAKGGVHWNFWRNQLSGIIPKLGDVIQDGNGSRYIVQSVSFLAIDSSQQSQRFRCLCLQSQRTG